MSSVSSVEEFDHSYREYAAVLTEFVKPPRVDYARLVAGRATLDRVVAGLNADSARTEPTWPRDQRLAFWINAYNVLTLQAIVNHYPIRGGWFSRGPSPSIRQIPGVWTRLTWPVAGRTVTLDDIEHRILRPQFADARIHFAINCASVGCPPLAATPYRAVGLDGALDAAARTYLGSAQGSAVDNRTLRVTSILDWYGDDFIAHYASRVSGDRPAKLRAILAVVSAYGPADAAALARSPDVSIRYIDYDWKLNDTERGSGVPEFLGSEVLVPRFGGSEARRSGAGFDALVEDLVKSLNKCKVAAADQKTLLGVLGPMKADMVET